VTNKQMYVVVVPVLPDERTDGKIADYVVQSHNITECWEHIDRYLHSIDLPYELKRRKKAACYLADNIPQQYLDTIGSMGYLGIADKDLPDTLLRMGFCVAWFNVKQFLQGGYRDTVGYYADGEEQPVLIVMMFPKWSKP
jgi:hypothetical protein